MLFKMLLAVITQANDTWKSKLFLLLLAFPFRFAVLKKTVKAEIKAKPKQISVVGVFY